MMLNKIKNIISNTIKMFIFIFKIIKQLALINIGLITFNLDHQFKEINNGVKLILVEDTIFSIELFL